MRGPKTADHEIGDSVVKTQSNYQVATYKVPEAAQVARVGQSAIRKAIKMGRMPHVRFGRNILIPKSAFHKWLDSCGGSFQGNGEAA